jgi:hypothetical protein
MEPKHLLSIYLINSYFNKLLDRNDFWLNYCERFYDNFTYVLGNEENDQNNKRTIKKRNSNKNIKEISFKNIIKNSFEENKINLQFTSKNLIVSNLQKKVSNKSKNPGYSFFTVKYTKNEKKYFNIRKDSTNIRSSISFISSKLFSMNSKNDLLESIEQNQKNFTSIYSDGSIKKLENDTVERHLNEQMDWIFDPINDNNILTIEFDFISNHKVNFYINGKHSVLLNRYSSMENDDQIIYLNINPTQNYTILPSLNWNCTKLYTKHFWLKPRIREFKKNFVITIGNTFRKSENKPTSYPVDQSYFKWTCYCIFFF